MSEVAPSKWDADFVASLEDARLFELVLASHFLHVADLLDLLCAKVATLTKGQQPEALRKKFGIKNDFTPEEE